MIKRLDETGAERIHPSGVDKQLILNHLRRLPGSSSVWGPVQRGYCGQDRKAADLAIRSLSGKHSSGVSAAYDFFFFADGSDFEPSVFELPDPELSDLVSFFSSFLPPESLESPFEDDPAEDFLA